MVKKSAQPRKAKPKQSSPQPAEALQRHTLYQLPGEHYQLAGEQQFPRMLTESRTYQELYGEHPIKGKLMSAFILRGSRRIAFRTGESLSGALELYTWIHGPYRPLAENEIQEFLHKSGARLYARRQLSFDEITRELQRVEELLRWKPRGSPPKRRPDAVSALELKLANPKLSWTNLARKMCRCEKAEREKDGHDFRCRERLRQEVNALKKVLDKYQIPY